MYKTISGIKIALKGKIASGGEGEIFDINKTSQYPNHCLKIYHNSIDKSSREEKIKYMVQHAPSQVEFSMFRICWPTELVYSNDSFVGFIMPKAFEKSVLSYELGQLNVSAKLGSEWVAKFNRTTIQGQISRLKLSTNITAAINKIHELNNYVFVDLKPQNLLVTNDGKVSLIDLDSIQIAENGKLLFPGVVSTPEYTPPESKLLNPKTEPISKCWDHFSLSVTLYEILCGIHPYAGTCTNEYVHLSTTGEKIQNNISPVNSNHKYFEVIPPPHRNIESYSPNLRKLFAESFGVVKSKNTNRPSCLRWGMTLAQEVKQFDEKYKERHFKQLEVKFQNLTRNNNSLKVEYKLKKEKVELLETKVKKLESKRRKRINKAAVIIPWLLIGVSALLSFVNFNSQTIKIDLLKRENGQLYNNVKTIPSLKQEFEVKKNRVIYLEEENKKLEQRIDILRNELDTEITKNKLDSFIKTKEEVKGRQSSLDKSNNEITNSRSDFFIKTRGKAKFRKSPDISAKVIMRIPENQTVEVIRFERKGYWQVRYRNRIGYLNSQYFQNFK